jgi:hypothetical protein
MLADTCGQGGRAFWNGRGSKVFGNTFRNIRNTAGTGVQGASVQALYLDDEMSGWEVYENKFINCQAGTFIGGGRDNSFHDNYCESPTKPEIERTFEWNLTMQQCNQASGIRHSHCLSC